MAEEDLTVPALTIVPFINTQQIDHPPSISDSNLIPINYVPEGDAEPKLSKMELMIGHYLINRQYESGTGLGKFKDGIHEFK